MVASILVLMLFITSINCGCILFSLIDCGEPLYESDGVFYGFFKKLSEDEKYSNLDKFSKELEDYERKIKKK